MNQCKMTVLGYTSVAVGWRALRNHKVGGDNVAMGVGALELDSSGNNNTAVGSPRNFFIKEVIGIQVSASVLPKGQIRLMK